MKGSLPPVQAQATIQSDTARIRVTEWRFPTNSETGWHIHGSDYVVVPMSTGKLTMQTRDGESINELFSGRSYTRLAGNEHNVLNRGDAEFVFLEIEMK